MRRKEVIYCSYCGAKNKNENILCSKCNKKIIDKDHLFKEYLIDHIKGDVEDNIFSIITKFIKTHMYGTLVTLTVIFSLSTVVVNKTYSAKNTYVPEVRNVVNKCSINVVESILGCEDGYQLDDNLCKKKEIVNAKNEKVCSGGYSLKNGKCVSNEKFTGTYKDVCEIPKETPDGWSALEDYPYKPTLSNIYVEVDRGNCTLMIIEMYNEYGEPGGGSALIIPYTNKLVCPDNTENINEECRKTSPVLDKYTCEDGALNQNNKCEIEKTLNPIKVCPEGSIFDEYCNKCIGE